MAPKATKVRVEEETPAQVEQTMPAHNEIAVLAYALWQERGCPDGSPEEDWLKAEQQLIQAK